MLKIIQALNNQAKTGAFRVSTVERAERYLARHPMSEVGPLGQALRQVITQIRADQRKAGI